METVSYTTGQTLGGQSNPLNIKVEQGCQRWLDRLPSAASVDKFAPGQHTALTLCRSTCDCSKIYAKRERIVTPYVRSRWGHHASGNNDSPGFLSRGK